MVWVRGVSVMGVGGGVVSSWGTVGSGGVGEVSGVGGFGVEIVWVMLSVE